jgi:hypothetical protein
MVGEAEKENYLLLIQTLDRRKIKAFAWRCQIFAHLFQQVVPNISNMGL